MSVGAIAGLIAAIAFVALVALAAVPLLKLGRVLEEVRLAVRELGRREGISAAPEGGAALQAVKQLLRDGVVNPRDTVVIFNTGGALKYFDALGS